MERILTESWRKFRSETDPELQRKFFALGYEAAKKITRDPQLAAADFVKDDLLLVSNLTWFSPLNRLYEVESTNIVTAPVVGIFCQGELSPSTVLSGKCGAGSEYAVVLLAETLAKRGYNVVVFCDFKLGVDWRYALPCSNPQYLPIKKSHENVFSGFTMGCESVISFSSLLCVNQERKPLDHLILCREMSNPDYDFTNYSDNLHLWCHDFFGGQLDYEPQSVYVLTEFHKQHAISKLGEKQHYVVGCNGTSIELSSKILENPGRDFYKCIYASNYSRGLEDLLEIWPHIRKRFPQASLDIYYGRETWGIMTPTEMAQLCIKIEDLKNQGVTEMGKVSHAALARAMFLAGFWLFPYKNFSETFCIVGAMAQQAGCIPVVKRDHGLLETVFQEAGRPELVKNRDFSNRVVELMKLGPQSEKITTLRQACYDHASKYTWEAAADKWEEAFSKCKR